MFVEILDKLKQLTVLDMVLSGVKNLNISKERIMQITWTWEQ